MVPGPDIDDGRITVAQSQVDHVLPNHETSVFTKGLKDVLFQLGRNDTPALSVDLVLGLIHTDEQPIS